MTDIQTFRFQEGAMRALRPAPDNFRLEISALQPARPAIGADATLFVFPWTIKKL
ncbi:hypothetical protein [Pigmentiphaga aceris]|uniref:hypothetical protein n=1 Tax=Pigmentiphaga aceris TaxID=1940612 RepID=UPI001652415A|nr:hypothetical protein [Pigmentiphaga aceris]